MLRGDVAPSTRRRLVGTWVFRTHAEIEAAARFDAMARALERAGAEPVVWQGAAAAADDERRHVRICAEVATAFGAEAPEAHTPPRVRIGRPDMDERDRLLWEVVSVCCVGETVNAALLTRSLEVATDESIRRVLRDLLRDEVRHSRIGWAHLASETRLGRGRFLPELVPLILEAAVVREAIDGEQEPWAPDMEAYGELSPLDLDAVLTGTLEAVVFPGFDALRVESGSGRRWLAARMVPGPARN